MSTAPVTVPIATVPCAPLPAEPSNAISLRKYFGMRRVKGATLTIEPSFGLVRFRGDRSNGMDDEFGQGEEVCSPGLEHALAVGPASRHVGARQEVVELERLVAARVGGANRPGRVAGFHGHRPVVVLDD